MADVTAASNASDDDVTDTAAAAAVLDGMATAAVWKPEVVARVTTIVVIMAATLSGNAALIAGITCHAALRRRRISVFLVNLAVADLMVCLVTMTTEILFVAFGQWVLGPAGCKLVVYGQIVTLASTTFLLTAMSIDSYQVFTAHVLHLFMSIPFIRHFVISSTVLYAIAVYHFSRIVLFYSVPGIILHYPILSSHSFTLDV